jgi:ABC-type polar amino acid transport system ATPase subunit
MANDQANLLTVSKTEVAIEINDMNKWYGEFQVLRSINLKVMKGERIVIAGPSGSGKSTMIRCINRLEEHQRAASLSMESNSLTILSALTRCDARSAWCFSTSIFFRT